MNDSPPNPHQAAPPREPLEAVLTCLRKYVDVRGRASFTEFMSFYIFTLLCDIATRSLGDVFDIPYKEFFELLVYWLLMPPLVTACIRRLHDTNRSGWRLLLLLPVAPLMFIKQEGVVDRYIEWMGRYDIVFGLYIIVVLCAFIYWMMQTGRPSKKIRRPIDPTLH